MVGSKKYENHVTRLISRFSPSVAEFARLIDVPYTTVHKWVYTDKIPVERWHKIIALGLQERPKVIVKLEDFMVDK